MKANKKMTVVCVQQSTTLTVDRLPELLRCGDVLVIKRPGFWASFFRGFRKGFKKGKQA